MANKDILRELAAAPITKLDPDAFNGDVRLRRRIKNAGIETIAELFALDAPELDSTIGKDDADAVLDMKATYEADPEGFARNALSRNASPTQASSTGSRQPAKHRNASERPLAGSKAPKGRPRINYASVSIPAPATKFASALYGFQAKAAGELDLLADHSDEAMVYQAFAEFSTELDELANAFSDLFAHYATSPRRALELIASEFPDAFLVYVSDRARLTFDGRCRVRRSRRYGARHEIHSPLIGANGSEQCVHRLLVPHDPFAAERRFAYPTSQVCFSTL